jgi:hypothetical protein
MTVRIRTAGAAAAPSLRTVLHAALTMIGEGLASALSSRGSTSSSYAVLTPSASKGAEAGSERSHITSRSQMEDTRRT